MQPLGSEEPGDPVQQRGFGAVKCSAVGTFHMVERVCVTWKSCPMAQGRLHDRDV